MAFRFRENGEFAKLPKVAADYHLVGSGARTTRSKKKYEGFLTREEKYDLAEQHFQKVFKEENGTELPEGTTGVVVIQQGHYPLDCDIAVNPTLEHHCAKQAIMIDTKVMRQSYTFVSRTYWLEAGKNQLERLIDSNMVLSQRCCVSAVKRYIKFKDKTLSSFYIGVELYADGKFKYPYRVWRLQRKDLSVTYLLISLLNGAMFELSPQDLPEMNEAPAEFFVGAVQFKEEDDGNYFRG